ncbi:RNA polymerase sigma factor [Paenibacillus tyrfis]|uniref:RNA polymerase sigma factor n=1 Tax=Paenibacillus tyrfis TaxID=1501230 RepID=UPI0015C69046|nr:sigma factor-like helix-turn-helix DNA-binding protein [Paenibacillus tyrfis]
MDRTDELSLMKKVRTGDTKAFRELVRPYEQRDFSTALAILGSQPLAEEAVQRVFVETYRTLKQKDICPFRDWLDDRIACSVLDAAGKRLRQETLTDADSALPGHSGLLRSVMTLELPYRIVMALAYCQQLTIPQIASLLNVEESEVRSRLYRARMKLLQGSCPLPA